MANGVAVGVAVRIIATICVILGSVGWALWFSLFRLPLWVQFPLAIAVPWMRYPSSALFLYSAEVLAYALTPWMLLVTYKLGEFLAGDQRTFGPSVAAAFVGLGLGFGYVIKYSTTLVSVGALAYVGLVVYRRGFISHRDLGGLVLAGVFFAVPVVGLSLLNYELGGAVNLVTASLGLNLRWGTAFFML